MRSRYEVLTNPEQAQTAVAHGLDAISRVLPRDYTDQLISRTKNNTKMNFLTRYIFVHVQ